MIKEFSTLSPGQPPGPASSPVSPPGAPQLAWMYEDQLCKGNQGKEPPGQSRIFPSMDVRSKDIKPRDQRTTSAIVDDLTLLCIKKKGGQFMPTEFLSASSCVLCDRGGMHLHWHLLPWSKTSSMVFCLKVSFSFFLHFWFARQDHHLHTSLTVIVKTSCKSLKSSASSLPSSSGTTNKEDNHL